MSPASIPSAAPPQGTKPAGALDEPAPAKLNLSLRILGRRPDGYHELESLVVFADAPAADEVRLVPGGPLHLDIDGPGAGGLAGEASNLVLRAAEAAQRLCPALTLGAFRLTKRLPIAAGLGGGSSDAAAALRLIRRADPQHAAAIDWTALAASIGADVPVCLARRASLMTGRGEQVRALDAMPPIWAVLANPGVPLATGPVFKALAAAPLRGSPPLTAPPAFADLGALITHLLARPNDLEATAIGLCPEVAVVKAALSRLDGALLARMSGSGPTCFALFASHGAATAGAAALREAHPAWWIAASALA